MMSNYNLINLYVFGINPILISKVRNHLCNARVILFEINDLITC